MESEGQRSKEEEFVPSLKMNQATMKLAVLYIHPSRALSRILSLEGSYKVLSESYM